MTAHVTPEVRKPGVVAGEQLQCYFWHGILVVGEATEHAFFDVKRRTNPDYSSASLFTTDVPPILVRPDEAMQAHFLLENSTGLQTVRHKVCSAAITGPEVLAQAALPQQAMGGAPPHLTVTAADGSEWGYIRLPDSQLVLYCITVHLAEDVARKYLPLPIAP